MKKPPQPKPPDWLDKNAKAAWRRLYPLANPTEQEEDLFISLCVSVGLLRAATEQINSCGFTIESDNGKFKTVKKHPACEVADEASRRIFVLSKHFGLTEARGVGSTTGDKWEQLLKD